MTEQEFENAVQEKGLNKYCFIRNDFHLDVALNLTTESFLDFAVKHTKDIYYSFDYPKQFEIMITGDTFKNANYELRNMIEDLDLGLDFEWFLDEAIFPEAYQLDEDEDEGDISTREAELDKMFSDFEHELKKKILQHNEGVDLSPLKNPRSFITFCIVDGKTIGLDIKTRFPSPTPAELDLTVLLQDYSLKMQDKRENEQKVENEKKDQLKEHLIHDPDFLSSKNKVLREDYADNLWKNPDFKWIKTLFKGRPRDTKEYPSKDFYYFIERIYALTKFKK